MDTQNDDRQVTTEWQYHAPEAQNLAVSIRFSSPQNVSLGRYACCVYEILLRIKVLLIKMTLFLKRVKIISVIWKVKT